MKIFCVISHTHWDREWYLPLELFRLKLVDLIDHCLEVLHDNPTYLFHLDAQTVVLEDYLAFRPERRALLTAYITEGRLIVGPWYLQNDYYLTSGEATVRNLLEGGRLMREFGSTRKAVGYAADQFGNISQLPQILKNFGIDNFIFGRGFARTETDEAGEWQRVPTPTEFIWEGADGTQALAIHMSHWYNNAQRFSADITKARELVDIVEASFEGTVATPYLLLMNGVDHLEAQEDLLPILEKVNATLPQGKEIRQCALSEYVEMVQRYLAASKTQLMVHHGELRYGGDNELLKGTLSSRVYLKTENVKAQNRLECQLEPLCALLELAGAAGVYSSDHFRYLWKRLMENHPHDSICGCSRDEVHAHMEDNYWRLRDTTRELRRRALETVAYHLDTAGTTDDYLIAAVNATDTAVTDVVEVTLSLPVAENFPGFTLTDRAGCPVPFSLLSQQQAIMDVQSPINLPGSIPVTEYRLRVYAADVNALAAKGFLVRRSDTPVPVQPDPLPMPVEAVRFENEFLAVAVSAVGAVTVTEKATGNTYENVLELEDTADCGDSYVYIPDVKEPALYGSDFPAEVAVTADDPLLQRCTIRRVLMLPEQYDFSNRRRAETMAATAVMLVLTLKKGVPFLEIGYAIDNGAGNHRLRLLVKTGCATPVSVADIPFDITTHTSADLYPDTRHPVFPNTSFAALEGETRSLEVFTEGQHEYEHLAAESTLAFTLLRATDVITCNKQTLERGGVQWEVPDNQCLRHIEARIGLMPYTGDYVTNGIPQWSKRFRNGLLCTVISLDPHKFTGGRRVVQDSFISEIFFRPDPYAAVQLPDNRSLLSVSGVGVTVTAFKQAETGQALILRLFNFSTESQTVTLTVPKAVFESTMREEKGVRLGGGSVCVTLRPKEIKTLCLDEA